MEWDQQTYMPRGGADARGEHVGSLSRQQHEIFTDQVTGDLLTACASEVDSSSDEGAMVRAVQRDFDLATKIPAALVERKSKLAVEAHERWVESRKSNEFLQFAPYLEQMYEICREEAECFGYKDHIYDALLDQYEEGATAADCRAMFDALRAPTVELVKAIRSCPPVDDSKLYGDWSIEAQRQFTESIVQAIGFDMSRGRQDIAPHPFCTGWSVGDIRLTTRYKPYIGSAIFGSLHEAGHGMYEQGSPASWDRSMPFLCGGVSLGLHESQSRLWENIVGRSMPFWKRFLPTLQSAFPALSGFRADEWYRAINKVEPSLIRVEADEVTYNLHVMIRFEIECDVLEGSMQVKDIPEVWNAKYEEYLGVRPPTDSDGCLQDVHWSQGSIGYFPTYSMGNLLSYQIWNQLRSEVGDTDMLIEQGQFAMIHDWLKLKIYSQGRRYKPKELVQRVTGKPMGAEDYIAGLGAKYRDLYGISAVGV